MAKASKYKKNTTEQEIEPTIDPIVSIETVTEAIQEVQVEAQAVQESVIEEATAPIPVIIEEPLVDIKVSDIVEQEAPVVENVEQPEIVPAIEPIIENVVEKAIEEVIPEPIIEQIIEVTPEPVIPAIPTIQPSRIGKLIVSTTFIKSTPTFFTWLHKQGYAILSRETNKNGDITFVIEGHSLDAIIGEPPIYSVTAGNRLHIVRK